ncbi:hypothetical protein HDU93_000276 [Gonapodya sp. JEL0774]|nr:hypothetical protein HDU93_000276 [Gonapodya sp. JEL0774]
MTASPANAHLPEELQILVLVLSGLPGAGKSFLCRRIKKFHEENTPPLELLHQSERKAPSVILQGENRTAPAGLEIVHCIHLEYDKLMSNWHTPTLEDGFKDSKSFGEEIPGTSEESKQGYKSARLRVLEEAERIIRALRTSSIATGNSSCIDRNVEVCECLCGGKKSSYPDVKGTVERTSNHSYSWSGVLELEWINADEDMDHTPSKPLASLIDAIYLRWSHYVGFMRGLEAREAETTATSFLHQLNIRLNRVTARVLSDNDILTGDKATFAKECGSVKRKLLDRLKEGRRGGVFKDIIEEGARIDDLVMEFESEVRKLGSLKH